MSATDFFGSAAGEIPRERHATALPLERQTITPAMRGLHRVASYLPVRVHQLRNPRPLLSVTFDDVPKSAVETGAAILERAGHRGTFYVATGLLGRATRDWQVASQAAVAGLAARGHEIGLHSHEHGPVAAMMPDAFDRDLAEARRRLVAIAPGTRLESYAFPFGFSNPMLRRRLARGLRSSRTAHPGLNRGRTDLHYLRSCPFGVALDDRQAVDRLLDETVARNGWLILTAHDVRRTPSPFGCTPDLLAHTIDAALARDMEVATVHEALDRCGVPAFGQNRQEHR